MVFPGQESAERQWSPMTTQRGSRSAARQAGTMITVAPTGAELEKSVVPGLPVTTEELVTTAKECRDAGAAMIHVHIRDDGAQPTLDLSLLKDTVHALRESTDLIVQLSTGGAVTDPFERRPPLLQAGPDSRSLPSRAVNLRHPPPINPPPFLLSPLHPTPALAIRP